MILHVLWEALHDEVDVLNNWIRELGNRWCFHSSKYRIRMETRKLNGVFYRTIHINAERAIEDIILTVS